MATTEENAVAIIEHAATLDSLVSQFRSIKADIEAREAEIRQSDPARPWAISGQQGLVSYARTLMTKPSITEDETVEAVATRAWSEFLTDEDPS